MVRLCYKLARCMAEQNKWPMAIHTIVNRSEMIENRLTPVALGRHYLARTEKGAGSFAKPSRLFRLNSLNSLSCFNKVEKYINSLSFLQMYRLSYFPSALLPNS